MSVFESYGLSRPLLAAITRMGFEEPTPIQKLALPIILEGKDLIAQAQTGTGKTAAFGIPMLESINAPAAAPIGLVLAPTRELAMQVAAEIKSLGSTKKAVVRAIYGGQAISLQIAWLKAGCHIVVGTPGRLLDHLRRGTLSLKKVTTLVLDEADRMLDMGFIEDIEAILRHAPKERQTLLFSATIPQAILPLAGRYLRHPETVRANPEENMPEGITHAFYAVEGHRRLEALRDVLRAKTEGLTLVFCQTKREVDRIVVDLKREGLSVCGIHGDYSQKQRDESMERFRGGKVDVLVATDLAARGLDVEEVARVVNYRVPRDATSYVHRAGRTGRAGRIGLAASLVSLMERPLLREIARSSHIPIDLTLLSGEPVKQAATTAAARSIVAHAARRSFGPGRGRRR
jgi:ATP-dependent RNA helicase DeaD